jgi:hypothetical protein
LGDEKSRKSKAACYKRSFNARMAAAYHYAIVVQLIPFFSFSVYYTIILMLWGIIRTEDKSLRIIRSHLIILLLIILFASCSQHYSVPKNLSAEWEYTFKSFLEVPGVTQEEIAAI